jgi:hypothetical protein
MDAIIEVGSDTTTAETARFKSRPGALIWSFRTWPAPACLARSSTIKG